MNTLEAVTSAEVSYIIRRFYFQVLRLENDYGALLEKLKAVAAKSPRLDFVAERAAFVLGEKADEQQELFDVWFEELGEHNARLLASLVANYID